MKASNLLTAAAVVLPLVFGQDATELSWPTTTPGDFTICNFTFDSGETIEELNMHYQTLGNLKSNDDGTTNAVLILHGSGGQIEQFLDEDYAGVLFNPGQPLTSEDYFLILRDGIGHGQSSSPRNTGLHASFPKYQYSDMVRADHQLLTQHFGINHTRLITGVSMGGMHTWMWGTQYPEFTDALFPIASLPTEIAGHNRMWRKMFMELIQLDSAWNGGEYGDDDLLTGLVGAMSVLLVMFESPLHMAREYPTREATDAYVDETLKVLLASPEEFDANNLLFAYNASTTYDPRAGLKNIKAPLTAVNTADDLLNPPELGILEEAVEERMTKRLGKAVVIPTSNETFGHGTYIKAELWKDELTALLARS